MGKTKKKLLRKTVRSTQIMVATLSDDALREVKEELHVLNSAYELILGRFNETMTKVTRQKQSQIAEKRLLLTADEKTLEIKQETADYLALTPVANSMLVSHEPSESSKPPVDIVTNKEIMNQRSEITGILSSLEKIREKLGDSYLNEFVLVSVKVLALRARLEYKTEGVVWIAQSAYRMFSSHLRAGILKYTDDIIFQREAAFIFQILIRYNDKDRLQLALEACLFADQCQNPTVRLGFYFDTLCMEDDRGLLMFNPRPEIKTTEFYQLYSATKKQLSDLITRNEVQASAILDFIDASFMMFFYKYTVSPRTIFSKMSYSSRGGFSVNVSDEAFCSHINEAKKLRKEYLDFALNLLAHTNLSVIFCDMEICTRLKAILFNHYSSLHKNVLAIYALLEERRGKKDDLSHEVAFETIEFERLSQILLDAHEYLTDGRVDDIQFIKDKTPYVEFKTRQKALKVLNQEQFLKQQAEADRIAQALAALEEKQKAVEAKRLEKIKAKEEAEAAKRLAVKSREVVDENPSSETAEVVVSLTPIEKFMHNASIFLIQRERSKAITAYQVAKQHAIKAGDTDGELRAIDGLIAVLSDVLSENLEYAYRIFSRRLVHQKVMPINEQTYLQQLLVDIDKKFNDLKIIYDEYDKIVKDHDNTDNDINFGIQFAKDIIEAFLESIEEKITSIPFAHQQLQEARRIEREDYIYQLGLKAWSDAGSKEAYDEAQIMRLGKKIHILNLKEKGRAKEMQNQGYYAAEKKLLKDISPLIMKLGEVSDQIRASINAPKRCVKL